jgi:hypothetical protein
MRLAVMPDSDALARIRHRLPVRGPCGPQVQAGGAGRTRARKKAARELAAALVKLQKGRRRQSSRKSSFSKPLQARPHYEQGHDSDGGSKVGGAERDHYDKANA